MDIGFLIISFIAGVLTILAPCALPLLPVIVGGSLTDQDKKRPIIITLSLALSVVLFTLLLKASTAFIAIPEAFWKWFSAGIILIFALSLLFPDTFARGTLALQNLFKKKDAPTDQGSASQKVLFKFYDKKGFWPAVMLGLALGPVFASCSPTYFVILGTVLPANFFVGLLNLAVYALGLASVMLLVAYAGQRIMGKLNVAANPKGWFKRGLGILFLFVAIMILTGLDKKLSTYVLDRGFLDITKVEEKILDRTNMDEDFLLEKKNNGILNQVQDDEHVVESDLFNTNVPAPDIKGLTSWMNSEGYESLDELKGKVVLVDFWTYSCINCIRTLPYLQDWQDKYADDGLVILGIHAPEFAFERKPENVAKAIEEYGLTYPVALDNDFATWRNYKNRYWPAKYIIDKEGNIRYYHFGEGEYAETEEVIAMLLGVEVKVSVVEAEQRSGLEVKTSETYLGTNRRENFVTKNSDALKLNEWTLVGRWNADGEKIMTQQIGAQTSLRFHAAQANLVMEGDAKIQVYIDGEKTSVIEVNKPDLYSILSSAGSKERTVTLELLEGYWEAFAWTFG